MKIKTKGMHCPSCENLIEKTALSIKGVKSAKSDFTKEETVIELDENVDINMIMNAISEKGYKCEIIEGKISDKNGEISVEQPNKLQIEDDYFTFSLKTSKYFLIAGGILFLLGLFLLIKYSFNFKIPEITASMSLALIFIVGILTSFHCVGMCSGFVLSYTTKEAMNKEQTTKSKFLSHLKYGSGKIITYTVLGALFGLIGSFITFTPKLKGIAAIIAGLFLMIYGLNMVFPWLRRLQFKAPKSIYKLNAKSKSPFVIGLLNGLMIACGPLQAMLIYSAGTGSTIQGALAMFVFSLGTLPLMLGFGSIATLLGSKFTNKILIVSALVVIILGAIMINRGLTLTGSGYDFNTLSTNVKASSNIGGSITGAAIANNGYQEIRMEVNRYGWQPDKFVLKKGVPIRWIINGKELTGCNSGIQVPKLGLRFDIKPGEQIIEFTPKEAGTIPWSCLMGMIPGTFIVKDYIDLSNTQEVQKELDSIPQQPKSTCSMGGGCGCGR